MKIFWIVLAVFFSLIIIWSIGQYFYLKKIETLSYTVLEEKNGYEIRQYPEYLIAQTTIQEGDMNSGFSIVAGYIFGGNTKGGESQEIAMTTPVIMNEKIAMTSPVLTESESMAFVLPGKYTLDTLPTPTDSRVSIEKIAEKKWAVLQYSWSRSETLKQKKLEKLYSLLEKDNISYTQEVQFAFFNPPLTLPFLLRNEVWVGLE